MKVLFDEVVCSDAGRSEMALRYKDFAVVGFSTGLIETANTLENYEKFDTSKSGKGKEFPPEMKFVSLVEFGSRIIFAAEIGSCCAKESSLASDVVIYLQTGMLCLATKSFFDLNLWQEALNTHACLLWEIRANVRLSKQESYPDGSYLANLLTDNENTDDCNEQLSVRIIKYRHSYSSSEEHYLLTNLLDYEDAPAKELASLFHKKKTMEETSDILKTHHCVEKITLRSKTPDLVRQEFFGLLLATYILRKTVLDTDFGQSADPYDLVSKDIVVMRL